MLRKTLPTLSGGLDLFLQLAGTNKQGHPVTACTGMYPRTEQCQFVPSFLDHDHASYIANVLSSPPVLRFRHDRRVKKGFLYRDNGIIEATKLNKGQPHPNNRQVGRLPGRSAVRLRHRCRPAHERRLACVPCNA